MSLIEWRDEFSIGIDDVDHEHKEMISLINELHDAMLKDNSEERVQYFLGEVLTKISAHFALEEKIMRERDYDEYSGHKDDHELLLDEIRDIMDRYDDEQEYSDAVLAEQLNKWFTGHFSTRDARLHNTLGGAH
ncbi:MAG: hemerythrin family protein [Proteobacteria bacterium]|nr:hemerythrin family protein [Pseudomonadota bacterium]